jgi:hypothetical protein
MLLLARIAMNTANLAVDDRVDGMREDELAAIAPSVDVAADDVEGHGSSVVAVRDERRRHRSRVFRELGPKA